MRQPEALLPRGAEPHGWHNEPRTAARVAALIERRFGRRYHPEHARKILEGRLNWAGQKPRRKARERDDEGAEGRGAMSRPASSAGRSRGGSTPPPRTSPASG